jgi:2-methylisocitrate lyase-like PEP mutase family enzyme
MILKARKKPYINTECFLDYIREIFLPNLNELRTFEKFAEEDAALLMENCPSHVGEEILSLLRDARVRIITWAPHTTHHTYLSAAPYMAISSSQTKRAICITVRKRSNDDRFLAEYLSDVQANND